MNNPFTTKPSTPYPTGIRRQGRNIHASFISETADCGVLLRSAHTDAEAVRVPFEEGCRCGSIYSMLIENVPAEYQLASFYQGENEAADRYGIQYVSHPYGEALQASQMESVLTQKPFDWRETKCPRVPYAQAVFYGLHVRGFTKHASSGVRHKGTFLGIVEKLDYLKELGVTSLLLQPAYEFIESEIQAPDNMAEGRSVGLGAYRQTAEQPVLNYWGYKEGFYYAPKASYAASRDAVTEFKTLVKECHLRGMELLMQFYFPHMVNECDIRPILEYWTMEYQVDGFQILADHINMELILNDPLLSDRKLIYYGFADSYGNGRTGETSFKRLCAFNESAMNVYRRFLKGDEHTVGEMMEIIRRNGHSVAYMNSVADYSGFRVHDLVSYDYKHNEENGEDNRDGSNYNYSWNCGEEGPSRKKSVIALREKQKRNIFAMLALSQGTPYLFMGDEMSRTQKGNNNPYNQDNEISWVNWRDLKKNADFHQFVKDLLAFRRKHPILHMEQPLTGADVKGLGYPDISFHGMEAYMASTEPVHREFGVLLCGAYAQNETEKADSLLFIAFNMHWQDHECALPLLRKGMKWQIALTTQPQPEELKPGKTLMLPARTVYVLEAVSEKGDRLVNLSPDPDRTGF
ncbi:MAG: hypothetical protein LUI10_13835 [Lachnospiraceae bacterium]|nr:hypothetical protein [Lachnospiraceae bacterium]